MAFKGPFQLKPFRNSVKTQKANRTNYFLLANVEKKAFQDLESPQVLYFLHRPTPTFLPLSSCCREARKAVLRQLLYSKEVLERCLCLLARESTTQ